MSGRHSEFDGKTEQTSLCKGVGTASVFRVVRACRRTHLLVPVLACDADQRDVLELALQTLDQHGGLGTCAAGSFVRLALSREGMARSSESALREENNVGRLVPAEMKRLDPGRRVGELGDNKLDQPRSVGL